MTLQDLKNHFQTTVDNFHLERQEAEKYLSPEMVKTFPKKAATELLNLIFKDILSELPEITERAILSYKKDLNFKWSKEQKTKYFKKEIKKLERYYKGSPFATWFVIDEFHNEIFKEHALKNIADTYLNELGKYEFWNELPLLENGAFDFSKLDFDKVAKAIKEIKSELKFTFFHLIKTKVMKIEFENFLIRDDEIKQKLTPDFINELRLCYSTTNWVFENEKIEIVPENLTHDYLRRNNPIGQNILKYYYLPTSKFFSESEYEKMVDTGYVGQKDATLAPYPFIIYGAYFGRIDLYTKLSLISFKDEKPYLNGNNNLHYFADFIPYFKEYAEGFKEGYNEFEDNCIKPLLPMFADKQDYILKVHEYLTKRIFFQHDWLNNHSGFVTEHAQQPKVGRIINAFEDGQKQGYFYRAWTIVFSNSQLFEPLFAKTINERANKPKIDDIEFLLGNMVDFTKDTEYSHTTYKSYAEDFCVSFNRLSKQLQQNELTEWVEKIDNGFYLDNALMVDKPVIYKENKWKKNYRLMKNLILNGIELVPENNTNKPPQQEKFQFTNKFDTVPEDKVYQYFFDKLVNPGYMTNEDLIKYLVQAFEQTAQEKIIFTLAKSPKVGTVRNIFYIYYAEIASKPHNEQKRYASLLGEHFSGYDTKKVLNNFARDYQIVRK